MIKKNNDIEQDCNLESIQKFLDEHLPYAGNQAGRAKWYQEAIKKCNALRKCEERDIYINQLKLEMNKCQKDSLDEMGCVSVDVDWTRFETFAINEVKEKDFLSALISFSNLREPSIKSEENQFLDTVYSVPVDRDGKSGIGKFGHDIVPSYQRSRFVRSMLLPALQQIMTEHEIDFSSLKNTNFGLLFKILRNSPLVSTNREGIVMNGIERFFKSDFCSASHILWLQIEDALRCILRESKISTTRIRGEAQRDLNLETMLRKEEYRKTIEDFLKSSPFTLKEINDILKPLRNDLAHGLISFSEFYNDNTFYSCWFMLRLCCWNFDVSNRNVQTLHPPFLLTIEKEGKDFCAILKLKNNSKEVIKWRIKNVRDNFFKFEDSPFLFRNKIPKNIRNIDPGIFTNIFNGVSNLLKKEGFSLIEIMGKKDDIDIHPSVRAAIDVYHPNPPSTIHWWTEYCKTAWIPLKEDYRVVFSNCYGYASLEYKGERLGNFEKHWNLNFNAYEGNEVSSVIVEEARKAILRDGSYLGDIRL